MIVCGLPASAFWSSSSSWRVWPRLNASTTESSSSNAATPVADAEASTISSAPRTYRRKIPRLGSGNAEVPLPGCLGQVAHEGDESAAVALQRLDRDPLLRAVVAAA